MDYFLSWFLITWAFLTFFNPLHSIILYCMYSWLGYIPSLPLTLHFYLWLLVISIETSATSILDEIICQDDDIEIVNISPQWISLCRWKDILYNKYVFGYLFLLVFMEGHLKTINEIFSVFFPLEVIPSKFIQHNSFLGARQAVPLSSYIISILALPYP